ncbi:MAG: hypothetical protein CMH65_06700 [Nevskiales bacterium]|nr:hypothetical protein [Nevskiales bacterium]
MSLTDLLELSVMLALLGTGLRLLSGAYACLASWKHPATAVVVGGFAGAWLCTVVLSGTAWTVMLALALTFYLGNASGGPYDGC